MIGRIAISGVVALGLGLGAGTVDARRIQMPTIPTTCPEGPSWTKVAGLIKRAPHGLPL